MTETGDTAHGDLPPGTYVRILIDLEDGNPPFGRVGERLAVGGLLVAQAGSGLGVFSPDDLVRVEPTDIPSTALADLRRRTEASRG